MLYLTNSTYWSTLSDNNYANRISSSATNDGLVRALSWSYMLTGTAGQSVYNIFLKDVCPRACPACSGQYFTLVSSTRNQPNKTFPDASFHKQKLYINIIVILSHISIYMLPQCSQTLNWYYLLDQPLYHLSSYLVLRLPYFYKRNTSLANYNICSVWH